MKVSSALYLLTFGTTVLACQPASEAESDVQTRADRMTIASSASTQESLGIVSWGIADGATSTLIRGYEASGDALASFEYSASPSDGTTFRASLDTGDFHAKLELEATADKTLRVIANSFAGDAKVSALLEHLVEDLRAQKAPATGGGDAQLASLRPLDGNNLVDGQRHLVNACQASLAPSGANAGQAANDCGKNPFSIDCFIGAFGAKNPVAGEGQCCSSAAATAEKYLNRDSGELARSGELPMDPSIDPSTNCANFVTATLQQSGQTNWHSNLVSDTQSRLEAEGWRQVPPSEAKPGDVAIINGNEHTELVDSNDGGRITLIGSNNVNADGSQRITKSNPYGNVVYLTPPDRGQCK